MKLKNSSGIIIFFNHYLNYFHPRPPHTWLSCREVRVHQVHLSDVDNKPFLQLGGIILVYTRSSSQLLGAPVGSLTPKASFLRPSPQAALSTRPCCIFPSHPPFQCFLPRDYCRHLPQRPPSHLPSAPLSQPRVRGGWLSAPRPHWLPWPSSLVNG